MRRLRFRFSLRTLLALVGLAGLGCYWLTLPTRYAEEFCRAMGAEDYDRVEKLFAPDCRLRSIEGQRLHFPRDWGSERQLRDAKVELQPWTMGNLWDGDRNVSVYIPYGEGMMDFDFSVSLQATRRGLEGVAWIH